MEQLRRILADQPWLTDVLATVGLLFGAWLALFLARRVAVRAVHAVVRRTRMPWDDALQQHKVFTTLTWFAPLLVLSHLGDVFPA